MSVRNKIIILVLFLIVISKSIYFQKWSEHNKIASVSNSFKGKTDSLIQLSVLLNSLQLNTDTLKQLVNKEFVTTKEKYGNRLGIGESAYFLVSTNAVIQSMQDGKWELSDGSIIDTKYIFGNEIRDASRFVHLEDYTSQNDLNAFTEYLNNYIRDEKIPNEIKDVHVGDKVSIVGACEVHPYNLPLQHLYIYPITIKKQ